MLPWILLPFTLACGPTAEAPAGGAGPRLSKAPAAVPTGTPAGPPPAVLPPASPATPALAVSAGPEVALSVFEPVAEGCRWSWLEPRTDRRVEAATFPGTCFGASTAWSTDGTLALVRFDHENRSAAFYARNLSSRYPEEVAPAGATDRLYRVTLPRGPTTEVPLPQPGRVHRVGFDAAGDLLAFTSLDDVSASDGVLSHGGKAWPVPPDLLGVPLLVQAWRRSGAGEWSVVETRVSDTGTEGTLGVAALGPWREVRGVDSSRLLQPHQDLPSVEDPSLLRRLAAFAPSVAGMTDGRWTRLPVDDGEVLVWKLTIEYEYLTCLVAFRTGNDVEEPPDLPCGAGDLVSVQHQGRLLLLSRAGSGAFPRLYDLRTRKLVWRSDEALNVTFWPGP